MTWVVVRALLVDQLRQGKEHGACQAPVLHAASLRDPLTRDSSPVDRSFEADSTPLPGSLLNSEVGPLPVVHT